MSSSLYFNKVRRTDMIKCRDAIASNKKSDLIVTKESGVLMPKPKTTLINTSHRK